MAEGVLKVLGSIAWGIWQVTTFWLKVRCVYLEKTSRERTDMEKRLWAWWTRKSKRDQLLETIDQTRLYEEWMGAAFSLDECMDYDLWSVNDAWTRSCYLYCTHADAYMAGDRAPRASTTTTALFNNGSIPCMLLRKRAT